MSESIESETTSSLPSKTHNQMPEGPLWITLDLISLLNQSSRYDHAALSLCNELVFHFRCTRVSIGRLQDDEMRLKATSHSNKIEKRTEIAQELERVMLEASDQDENVVWPTKDNELTITREHQNFHQKFGATNMLSMPLRINSQVIGTLTLQRENAQFKETEVEALRLICDLVTPRLEELHKYARGWWFLGENKTRSWLATVLGPEHTWWKFGGLLVTIVLLFLCLYPWPYKVSGEFILKTDALINLPAPFQGYIKEVHVIPGKEVKKEEPLIALDTRELKLQESEVMATMQRYRSEAQVALGQSSLGDMHIATAKAAQSESELKQTRYKLSRSKIVSPFDGVIVEGALTEQIGAPVEKGDVLMKIARLEDLYTQAMIPEEDIQEVLVKADGAIAFKSRPEIKYPITVRLIEPSAVARDKKNVFYVRCSIECPPDEWWRPGMTGIVKINAGTKPPLYMMTHRLIDFLRLKLWL
ncbi:MAG: efflux RND transporter periplasmic adaptor subunit [Verrucomicrobiota bacterium]